MVLDAVLAFVRWKRYLAHDPAWQVPADEQRSIRRLITIELHLAGAIPVFAVVMSRGIAQ